jgi:hypothetical protein
MLPTVTRCNTLTRPEPENFLTLKPQMTTKGTVGIPTCFC